MTTELTNIEIALQCAHIAADIATEEGLPLIVAVNGVTHAILALIDLQTPKPQGPINIHPVPNAPERNFFGKEKS